MVDYLMIYTTILLGLYILPVLVLFATACLRPHRLYRLHPLLLAGLYSFVPALALGIQMLRVEFRAIITPMPLFFSGPLIGLAGFALITIVPARKWIRRSILELSMKTARGFLERLPGKMMEIETQLSLGKLDLNEADRLKALIQRQVDRLAANDGLGRLLYYLLKLHLLRLTLQVAGALAISAWSNGISIWRMLTIASSLIIVDGALILVPYLLLLAVTALHSRQSHPYVKT